MRSIRDWLHRLKDLERPAGVGPFRWRGWIPALEWIVALASLCLLLAFAVTRNVLGLVLAVASVVAGVLLVIYASQPRDSATTRRTDFERGCGPGRLAVTAGMDRSERKDGIMSRDAGWRRCWPPLLLLLAACGAQVAVTTGVPGTDTALDTGREHSPMPTPDTSPGRVDSGTEPTALVAPEESGTSTSQPVEVALLHRIAELLCPYPDPPDRLDPYERHFDTEGPIYRFVCIQATSHSISVAVRHFDDKASARAEFEARKPPGAVETSDGYAFAAWQEQDPSFPGGREEHRLGLMLAGTWFAHIGAFDDTSHVSAPDPGEASRDVFQALQELGLVQPSSEVSP